MLDHQGTKKIETQRLLLRKYCESDAADIFKNYASDEEVTRFLPWEPYENVEDVKLFISSQLANDSIRAYNWVISYGGEVTGSISVTSLNEQNESCEIGYCLGRAFWNQGILSEALAAVVAFLFGEVSFHRVMAKHDVENPASGRVMQKCGMVYEGRLREHYRRRDGSFADAQVYGLLKQEAL